MRWIIAGIALLAMPVSGGCVARTAAAIVTAPVKIASGAVDAATTSQSEADEKRGRELSEREEELAKLERRYEKQLKRCREGDRRICEKAKLTYADIQKLMRELSAEPEE